MHSRARWALYGRLDAIVEQLEQIEPSSEQGMVDLDLLPFVQRLRQLTSDAARLRHDIAQHFEEVPDGQAMNTDSSA